MKRQHLKLIQKLMAGILVLSLINIPVCSVSAAAPADQSFQTDDVGYYINNNSLCIMGIVYQNNRSTTSHALYLDVQNSSGIVGNFTDNRYMYSNPSQDFWFASEHLSNNYKMESCQFYTFTGVNNFNTVVNIYGYDGGIGGTPTVQALGVDFNSSGTYGTGNAAVSYSNSTNAPLIKGGTLTFGSDWNDIDTVRFSSANSSKNIIILLDNLNFSEPTDIHSPQISSVSAVAPGNAYIDVSFSELVRGENDGSTLINANDFILNFRQNGGCANDASIISVTKTTGGPLDGTEEAVRFNLSVSGGLGIADGREQIEIKPADGASVYDLAGHAMESTQTSGLRNLYDMVAPVVSVWAAGTAGGDALVNAAEKAAGFHAAAMSNESTGTLYVVPAGTASNIGAITAASIGSAPVTAADAATTIPISANHAGITDGAAYKVYAVDATGNISSISSTVFTAELSVPAVTVTAGTTAGGDAIVSSFEKTGGFTVTAKSSEATGNLYVVPDGTAKTIAAITGAAIGSAASAGAGVDTTIAISAGNTGVVDEMAYKVYAIDAAGNISNISAVAFTAVVSIPAVTIVSAGTAGGDALINIAEKGNGFNVTAKSSKATGTLYVVPAGTTNTINAITGASIGSAASAGAAVDTTIAISAGNTGVVDGTVYKVYAIDTAGNISDISSVAFTAELTVPAVTVTTGTTAGGDAIVSSFEKTGGFTVTAKSSEATGNLYVVPDGTAKTIAAITGAAIGSAASAGAAVDTTIAISAGSTGVVDGTVYKVYAIDAAGNISDISAVAFTAVVSIPAVTIVSAGTAGGDALINIAEKGNGFNVTAKSSKATGTLYVVPAGTTNTISAITGASIGSAASAGAGVDTSIAISAGNAGVVDGTVYKVYAIDAAGNISDISGVAFTAVLSIPAVTITAGTTAGGDALINAAEKTAGFNVTASSSKASGTLYVVPAGTAKTIAAITGSSIGSAASAGAAVDTTIAISAGNTGVVDGTVYKVYAIDTAGNISDISSVTFTAELTVPAVTIASSATAGGDALINAGEKTSGFSVTAKSSKATGTLYVVPAGTVKTISAITGASIGSAASAGAAVDTTIAISAGNTGVIDEMAYKVYAIDTAGNISDISGVAFTAMVSIPTVTIVSAATAGGDALINAAEKTAGFSVTAKSSKATGTLYVVPAGTVKTISAITGASIGSAASAGAAVDTTIAISAGNAGVIDEMAYKVYAIDTAGNISDISGVAFTAVLGIPQVTITAGTTAGGDALINAAEKTSGFSVTAKSSKATGTLYVVPAGTANTISAITGAAIGSAASAGAAADTTIAVSAGSAGVIDGMAYKVYAIDEAGNISVISGTAFTADIELPEIHTSATGIIDNPYIDVTFSEPVRGAADGTTLIDPGKFAVNFISNGGTAAGVVISSITNLSDGTLTGNETTLRFHLSVSGIPNGLETVEIKPVGGNSIYDIACNPMTVLQTAGVEYLKDMTSPEIDVSGNSVSIVSGDTTPAAEDHTDFGSVFTGTGTIERTFTIKNTGTRVLDLTNPSPYILITGDISDFTLTQIPDDKISISGSTTFKLTFKPTVSGLCSATVSIMNSDSDESVYSFGIQGTGVPAQTTEPQKEMLSYKTHVQDVGWQGWVGSGLTAGTTGQSKRMEAVNIKLENIAGGIEYCVHVQDNGWMQWVSDGNLAGTTGQSKRIEAIRIRLTGQAAEIYDVYYRSHVQGKGWLDWAKNGDPAGSAGLGYRMEAIEVVLVRKGGAAPGPTIHSFSQG